MTPNPRRRCWALAVVLLAAFALPSCKKDSPTAPNTGNPPEMPTGLVATANPGQVTLVWNPVADATGYVVYWDTAGDVDNLDPTIPSDHPGLSHDGLSNGTTYNYRVAAVNGAGSSSLSPQVSATPSAAAGIRLIACGDYTSFLVNSTGDLYAWGENDMGQLGIGSFHQQRTPALVAGISDVIAVDASRYHTVALTASGQAYAWGENELGQLGNGTTTTTWWPTPVSGPTNFVAIAAGQYHSLGVTADGGVWAWGMNSDGQLGLGHSDGQTVPGLVMSPSYAPGFVVAGRSDSFYKASNGTSSIAMYSWGINSGGQLGRGDPAFPKVPSTIAPTVSITAAATRLHHVLALRSDGSVLSWGSNGSGQLGRFADTTSANPDGVELVYHVIAVGAGNDHSIALGDDGRIMAWGSNGFGQLGDGTFLQRSTRVWVSDLTGVQRIATGGSHNLAVRNDGSVWAWGDGTYGQLGNGGVADSNVPVRVTGY